MSLLGVFGIGIVEIICLLSGFVILGIVIVGVIVAISASNRGRRD